MCAYQHLKEHFAKNYNFGLVVLDFDDSLHLLIVRDVEQLLTRAGEHNAMFINWLVFGPSGHVVSPAGLVIGGTKRSGNRRSSPRRSMTLR
jgi:hypothetical protein